MVQSAAALAMSAFCVTHPKPALPEAAQNRSFPAASMFPKTCHANGCYLGAASGPVAYCPILSENF